MKTVFTTGRIAFTLLLLFTTIVSSAQPGCPAVNAGNDVTLPCGTNCANLTATAFPSGNTTSYGVSSIAYTPFAYNAGTSILVNQDDIWSSVINLPFTFCFFGQAYTQVVVGANGLISFDVSEAGNGCAWATTGTPNPTLPTTDLYTNSIMGPYHDIDPSLGGTIKYQIIGTAPCRIFVVSYYQVPMYDDIFLVGSCFGITEATHQIVLYETTNAIEVYIKDKEACTGWNDGLATLGIQNATGTTAFVVPGRNNSVWDATNEGWRFTPNGPTIVTVDWFDGATPIGTGNTVQVCPSAATTYTARATYLPCSGGTPVVVNDNVTVSLAGTLQSGITASQNVSCFGGSNGSATATVSGGTPPVTYGWTDGSSALSRTNLVAGTYIFTATDASSCTRTDTVVLTQPSFLTVSVPDVSQTNCSGTGTGTLAATSTGGTQPYTFVWNSTPVQNDSILNGVVAGTYTASVTDANGCSATDNGTLSITSGGNNVVLGNPAITNVSCNGGNNGAITASATGGSGVYTFTWTNNLTGATISSLSAGQYDLTVDDGAGCTVTGSYNVTQPAALLIDSANVVNIGCNGGVTGSVTVYISGGTTPYSFSWVQQSNNQSYTGQNISGLTPDTYTLTLTDANNCTATNSYTITQATPLTFTQSSTDATCNGGSNGSATISIISGTAPYTYNWNNTGATSNSTLNSVPAGTVTVVIADANCSATASFTIAEPPVIVISQDAVSNVSCGGGTDGSITVSATGGTPNTVGSPYSFNWSNLQTTPTATGLAAGTHTVTVTDANTCTVAETFTITGPTAITGNTTVTNAPCYQAPGGSIALTVAGGTPPYQFLWTDGQTTQSATALLAGSYTVTVVDNNGCVANFSAQVNEPTDRNISVNVTAVKCIGDANGTISINVSGGTPPYAFSVTQDQTNFVFPNPASGVAEGLAAGTYYVHINDNNGCYNEPIAIVPNASADAFVTSADSTSCYGAAYADGAAYINATSVQNGPYEYSIDGGLPQYSGDFYNLTAGPHVITAANRNGCLSTATVIVPEPLPLEATVTPDTLILPLGESGTVLVNHLNTSSVSYTWTPEQGLSCVDCPNPTVSPYESTDYIVTVTSQDGTVQCFATATLRVEVLPHEPVFVPNSFSPNGDGNNDVFMVYGEDIKLIDLKIFNRWGELVYKSNNAMAGWDGTYKGQFQNPQVFTYTVDVTFLNNKETRKKGSIMLLR